MSGAGAETGDQETAGVKEKLGEVKATVKQEASQFASDAQSRAKETVAQKQQAVGGALQTFADAIRTASDQLGEREQTQASKFVRQAADGLEGFARNISDKSPEEMLRSARELGRSNPTALLIGSVLAGVVVGRFIRSTSADGATTGSGSGDMTTLYADDTGGDVADDAMVPEGEPASWSAQPMDPIAQDLEATTRAAVDDGDEAATDGAQDQWSEPRREV